MKAAAFSLVSTAFSKLFRPNFGLRSVLFAWIWTSGLPAAAAAAIPRWNFHRTGCGAHCGHPVLVGQRRVTRRECSEPPARTRNTQCAVLNGEKIRSANTLPHSCRMIRLGNGQTSAGKAPLACSTSSLPPKVATCNCYVCGDSTPAQVARQRVASRLADATRREKVFRRKILLIRNVFVRHSTRHLSTTRRPTTSTSFSTASQRSTNRFTATRAKEYVSESPPPAIRSFFPFPVPNARFFLHRTENAARSRSIASDSGRGAAPLEAKASRTASEFLLYGRQVSGLLQDYDIVFTRANHGLLQRLLHRPLHTNRRQGKTHRGL